MRLPETKQERSALSTGKLLDAAAELIAEVGYERMTLAAIGQRAGYSHGLVTARFGSKEGLLWALVERMVDAWQIDVETMGEPPSASDSLHALLRGMRQSWSRHPKHMQALYGLMFEALLPIPLLNERMRELHRKLRDDIEQVLRRDIDKGVLPDDLDVLRVARLVVGGIRGAIYQTMLDPKKVTISTALSDVESLVDALIPAQR
ncbi:TetR/AcrR family transcriptional regulator [Pseudonocardia sp. CA-107938]|uniref:TetR/AcrR family transcriptional regulator n=1 Tax=Pseudonocardia sp. CA-107938 TaxID=3240021 RepID=UPI003D93EE1A